MQQAVSSHVAPYHWHNHSYTAGAHPGPAASAGDAAVADQAAESAHNIIVLTLERCSAGYTLIKLL